MTRNELDALPYKYGLYGYGAFTEADFIEVAI